jgi:hypothetical protein
MFYFKRTIGLLLGAGLVLLLGTNTDGIDAPKEVRLEVQEVKTDSRSILTALGGTEPSGSGSITVYTSEEMEALENPEVQPVVPAGQLLLDAARTQIGIFQDCTAMVENSLRALGHQVGDIGPMNFGGYGTQVDAASAQPGDIMMRWGHVAIYSGNGSAVHGGYNGTTLETAGSISSPYNYAVIIRIG